MNTKNFSISDNAAKRISFLMSKDGKKNVMLRISVDGGGCSGFQYKYEFTNEPPADDDLIFENKESKVVIDKMSLEFIEGAQVDYIEELGAAYFSIKNPNASNSCGCGNSFSV
jgi:iron-sulfur cluster insertion protein